MISEIFRFQKTHKLQFVAPPIGGITPLDQVRLSLLTRLPFALLSSLYHYLSLPHCWQFLLLLCPHLPFHVTRTVM